MEARRRRIHLQLSAVAQVKHPCRERTIWPSKVCGTNSWKSWPCHSVEGSLVCMLGVLTAGKVNMLKAVYSKS